MCLDGYSVGVFMHRRHCVKRVCHFYRRFQDTDGGWWYGMAFRYSSLLKVAEAALNIPSYVVYSKQPGSGG